MTSLTPINACLASHNAVLPAVGMAATILCWSDRMAGTVTKVTAKSFTVQLDHAVRTDTNGMSEAQSYDYSRNPTGASYVFRLTKRGWRCKSYGVLLGVRRQYHDFSF